MNADQNVVFNWGQLCVLSRYFDIKIMFQGHLHVYIVEVVYGGVRLSLILFRTPNILEFSF